MKRNPDEKANQHTSVTLRLNADTQRVWQVISAGDNVDRWLPAINACQLQGSGEGATRICASAAGDLHETIVTVDHAARIFQYSIEQQAMLPISHTLATMTVEDDVERAVLTWRLDYYLADESQVDVVRQAVEQLYTDGAKGLEKVAQ